MAVGTSRHFLVGHGQGGLGRDIAQGGACAAGGQHQVASAIHQLDQRLRNQGLLVGDESGLEVNRVEEGAL
jgi:hypothetical protein